MEKRVEIEKEEVEVEPVGVSKPRGILFPDKPLIISLSLPFP